MTTSKIYAVDFDDTICFSNFPELGEPNLPLIEQLKSLQQQGHHLILWTCRNGKPLQDAVEFSAKYGLKFDAVNENLDYVLEKYGNIDSRKVTADFYIDDKSLTPETFMLPLEKQPLTSQQELRDILSHSTFI